MRVDLDGQRRIRCEGGAGDGPLVRARAITGRSRVRDYPRDLADVEGECSGVQGSRGLEL